jgi:ABC-type uncharacterized transport system ATPase subunit
MAISLSIPLNTGGQLDVPYKPGTVTFVVGANGTGKSALMVKFKQALGDEGHRIVAARPIVLQADAPEIPTAQAVAQRQNISGWDSNFELRARMVGGDQRAQLYLQTLSELESSFHRSRSDQFEALDFVGATDGQVPEGTLKAAKVLQAERSPLSKINEALRVSGFLIQLKISDDGQVRAAKGVAPDYGVSQTSDGERAALILLIETLAARSNQVLLIDEPERHIHRALLHPLILELVRLRADCSFIVSTHDIEFVSQFRAPVVLLRDMTVLNQQWTADLVADSAQIDDSIREDILGGRRRVLFVEGKPEGKDDRLYNLLFEGVSVIAKGGSRNVLEATRASRSLDGIAWLEAWGIIDRDGRPDDEVAALREQFVWPLPVYAVESVYYHPKVIERLIAMGVVPSEECELDEITTAAIEAIKPDLERLAARSIEKSVRHAFLASIPKWDGLKSIENLSPSLNPKALFDAEIASLNAGVSVGDWSLFVSKCPIHETRAPDKIAKALGYAGSVEYEDAIREAVVSDKGMRTVVYDVLGDPVAGLTFKPA